jgi:hypothetical protein
LFSNKSDDMIRNKVIKNKLNSGFESNIFALKNKFNFFKWQPEIIWINVIFIHKFNEDNDGSKLRVKI